MDSMLQRLIKEIRTSMEYVPDDHKATVKNALDLLQDTGNVNNCNSQGQTALHLLSQMPKWSIVRDGLLSSFINMLVEHLAENIDNINKPDENGNTPLMNSLNHVRPNTHTVEAILKNRPDFHVENNWKRSAIDYLIERPKIAYVVDLIPYLEPAGLSVTTHVYGTPIIFLITARIIVDHPNLSKNLLEYSGEKLQLGRDSSGRSCFRFLLEKGIGSPSDLAQLPIPDVHIPDSHPFGISDMHALVLAVCNFALFGDSLEVQNRVLEYKGLAVKMIDLGANVSFTDNNGMTPLHVLWHYGNMYYLPFHAILPLSEFLESKSSESSKQLKDKFGNTFTVYKDLCNKTFTTVSMLYQEIPNFTPEMKSSDNPFKEVLLDRYEDHTTIDVLFERVMYGKVIGEVFPRQSEENEQIRQTMATFTTILSEKVKEIDPGFSCTPHLAGSSSTGTKTSRLDEFDYQFIIDRLQNVTVEHIDKKGCIVYPQQLPPTLHVFRHTDGYALLMNLSKRFGAIILTALADDSVWDGLHLRYNCSQKSGKPGLIKLSLTWMGGPSSYMEIHVDLLPVIMMETPVPPRILGHNQNLVRAFNELGYIINLYGEAHASLSFSWLESHIMSCLPDEYKAAYGVVKVLCDGTFLPPHCRGGAKWKKVNSYTLKTSLFNCMDPDKEYPLSLLCLDAKGKPPVIGIDEGKINKTRVKEIMVQMMQYHKEKYPSDDIRANMPAYFDNYDPLLRKLINYSNPDFITH